MEKSEYHFQNSKIYSPLGLILHLFPYYLLLIGIFLFIIMFDLFYFENTLWWSIGVISTLIWWIAPIIIIIDQGKVIRKFGKGTVIKYITKSIGSDTFP